MSKKNAQEKTIAQTGPGTSRSRTVQSVLNSPTSKGGQRTYDRAITDYGQAIQFGLNDAPAHVARGNSYLRKAEYDRAFADCDEAIQLEPKFAAAYRNRGRAYEAKNDLGHAIADHDQALTLDPSLPGAREDRERVQPLLARGR